MYDATHDDLTAVATRPKPDTGEVPYPPELVSAVAKAVSELGFNVEIHIPDFEGDGSAHNWQMEPATVYAKSDDGQIVYGFVPYYYSVELVFLVVAVHYPAGRLWQRRKKAQNRKELENTSSRVFASLTGKPFGEWCIQGAGPLEEVVDAMPTPT